MEKHVSDFDILNFLSNSLPEDEEEKITRHIADCDDCLDRVQGFVYLKKNYNRINKDINIKEMVSLQTEILESEEASELEDLEPQKLEKEEQNETKVLSFRQKLKKKWWIPASAAAVAAAAFFILFFNQLFLPPQYNYWQKAGVLESTASLNEPVEKGGLEIMLSRLSGVHDMKVSAPGGRLTVKDGAAAIQTCFKLDDRDYKAMLANMNPDSGLTYKTAINLIDNFAGGLYQAETTTDRIKSNFAINSPDTRLKNVDIPGNLYILQGVGDGNVTLDNVRVAGRTYILGGGMASVVIKDSTISEVYVNKEDGKVRIYAENNTQIGSINLDSGAKLQNDGKADAFKSINVSENIYAGSELIFNGSFSSIGINAPGLSVKLENGVIAEFAAGGKAVGSIIEIAEKGVINEIKVDSAVTVTGKGVVKVANINAVGAKLNVKVEQVNKSEEVKEQEPERLFDDDGKALNGLDSDPEKLKALFIKQYSKKINKARKSGKAAEVEGFVFLPDQNLTGIISNTTEKNYFSDIPEIGGFGSPGRVNELASLASLKNTIEENNILTGIDVENINSLEGIGYLQGLKQLTLLRVMDIDLSPLADLKNLKSFKILPRQDIDVDLSPLAGASSIENLIIVGYNVTWDNLNSLSGLDKVKSLTMYGFTNLKDMYFLKGMKALEELDLRFVSARNPAGVETFKEMTSLKKLVMQEMTGWVPYVYYPPALEDLTLYFAANLDLVDIMSKIPNLRRATLNNNDLLSNDNWEQVLTMKKLEYLNLSGGNWLNQLDMRKICDEYFSLPKEQQNEASFREVEKRMIESKKQKIAEALPNCKVVYGQRELMRLPGK